MSYNYTHEDIHIIIINSKITYHQIKNLVPKLETRLTFFTNNLFTCVSSICHYLRRLTCRL